MAEKTKQHYVPKFYMKNFANGKLFNLYNYKQNLMKNDIPYASQCYKNNFYGKDKKTENELSILETKWSVAIKNVLEHSNGINIEDERLIKQFCCYQYLRTEKAVEQTKYSLYEAYKKMIPIILQFEGMTATEQQIEKYAFKYANDLNVEKSVKNYIKIAKENYKMLYSLKLVILENQTDIEFITSDNPIIIGNEFQSENGLGINSIGVYFLFPISPSKYVLIYDDKIYTKIFGNIVLNKNQVQMLNISQLQNCLENIFSATYNGVNFIKSYIISKCGEIRKYILTEHNRTQYNFLAQEYKGLANKKFEQLLNSISDDIICLYYKYINEELCFDFLEIDDSAKPFQNCLNYTFSRDSTKKQIEDRIFLMNIGNNPNIKLPFKTNIQHDEENKSLVDKWEIFLKNYFQL